MLLWKQQMWGAGTSCSRGDADSQKTCTCAAVPAERHPVRPTRGTRRLSGTGAEITRPSLSLPLAPSLTQTHTRTLSHNRSLEAEAAARGATRQVIPYILGCFECFSVQWPLKDDQEEQEVGGTKQEAALGNKEAIKA